MRRKRIANSGSKIRYPLFALSSRELHLAEAVEERRAVEGLHQVALGAGALGAHDGADVEFGHAHHDLRLDLRFDRQRLRVA